MQPSVGVVVGRFQVPELHEGHLELFREVSFRHQRVIVFVGLSSNKNPTRKHPLDFETRRLMLQASFPSFTVLPLEDKRTDSEWSQELDRSIRAVTDWGEVILYGSRKSFIPHYKGAFPVQELTLANRGVANGTVIRAALTNTIKQSFDFRAGIIYAANNRRPLVHTTVDVAILYKGQMPGDEQSSVYLGMAKKKDHPGVRFVGGFADIDSVSFEEDAKREVYEETDIDINSLIYLGSFSIPDWRYNDTPGELAVKTLFFIGWATSMCVEPRDDIQEFAWYKIPDGLDAVQSLVVPEHRELLNCLKKFLF